jgi:hypothetical protein
MAITALTVLAYNARARKWSLKGDGATTTATIPDDGQTKRAGDKAVSKAFSTITKSDYDSAGGGLLVPIAGTAQAITSTTVNSNGTLTIVFSAAPGNGTTITGYTLWNQDRPEI